LISGATISSDSLIELSTTIPYNDNNIGWKGLLDPNSVLKINSFHFFKVSAGVETELSPTNWIQVDKKSFVQKPELQYPVTTQKSTLIRLLRSIQHPIP